MVGSDTVDPIITEIVTTVSNIYVKVHTCLVCMRWSMLVTIASQ